MACTSVLINHSLSYPSSRLDRVLCSPHQSLHIRTSRLVFRQPYCASKWPFFPSCTSSLSPGSPMLLLRVRCDTKHLVSRAPAPIWNRRTQNPHRQSMLVASSESKRLQTPSTHGTSSKLLLVVSGGFLSAVGIAFRTPAIPARSMLNQSLWPQNIKQTQYPCTPKCLPLTRHRTQHSHTTATRLVFSPTQAQLLPPTDQPQTIPRLA